MVSEEIKNFVYRYFENIEQLRIVLLLHGDPNRDLSLLEICSRVYLPPDRAIAEIQKLEKKGLVGMHTEGDRTTFRYFPQSEEIAHSIDTLAVMDREMPVTLINLIYDRSRRQLRIFADAFRLKKDE